MKLTRKHLLIAALFLATTACLNQQEAPDGQQQAEVVEPTGISAKDAQDIAHANMGGAPPIPQYSCGGMPHEDDQDSDGQREEEDAEDSP